MLTEKQVRWALAVFSGVLVSLPLLVVTFPPSADLPQHVAQVRLFAEAFRHPDGLYRIQWFTPYSAVTLLFGIVAQLVTPLAIGRVGLLALGVMWTGAAHWVAYKRGRTPEAAMLASVLFLGLSTYSGFCSFLIGWPMFLLWFERTSRPSGDFRKRDAAVLFVLATLLYSSHMLWYAVAWAWLLLSFLLWRPAIRVMAWQLAVLTPTAVAAVIWGFTSRTEGYIQRFLWTDPILARLRPDWWVHATFRGVQGSTETWMWGALFLWVAAGVWQHRRSLRRAADPKLLVIAVLAMLGVWLAPNVITYTFSFSERFAAPALVLLLLAVPAPDLRTDLRRGLVAALLVVFCGSVAMNWKLYDSSSFDGFQESVAALPANQRVLGLDFIHDSEFIQGNPFIHQVAYAQMVKGGLLDYSFAEAAAPLVVFKDPEHRQWTRWLRWHADRLQISDLRFFDYLLVGGPEISHRATERDLPVTAVTTAGTWRLYRILPVP